MSAFANLPISRKLAVAFAPVVAALFLKLMPPGSIKKAP
jgi:hypothetical protein